MHAKRCRCRGASHRFISFCTVQLPTCPNVDACTCMGGGSATAGSLYCRNTGLALPNVASNAATCNPVSYHSSVRTCTVIVNMCF